jgi:hypothetical protein
LLQIIHQIASNKPITIPYPHKLYESLHVKGYRYVNAIVLKNIEQFNNHSTDVLVFHLTEDATSTEMIAHDDLCEYSYIMFKN